MQTIKAASVLVVMSVTAYALWLTTDTIVWFAREAASLALLSVRVCGGLLIVLVATGAAWLLLRQQYERNRQRDGAFALREYWLAPWWVRLGNWLAGRPNARLIYDPNANMSHAAIVHDNIYIVEPSAGWDRQLAYQQDIERTRRTQAAVPGDGVLGLPWWAGSGAGAGVANAATGRLLAGAYDRQPRPVTVTPPPLPAPELPPPPALTPAAAVDASQPAAPVLGQTERGEIVRWDMARTPHLRFHGTTQGSGKTNAIQTLAACALKSGAHVVVCDRVDFKDWGDFAGRAELIDTADPAALAGVTARLLTIYHNRTRQLARAGVKNVESHGRMQRIVVIISEFGAQMDTARAAELGPEVEAPLVELARLAGSAGIHLVAEDQAVKGWHRMLTTNLIPAIGYMPLYAAQACGWQGRGNVTPETFPLGTFWFGGRTFAAPHMQPALRTLLADVPAPRHLVMLTPPWGEHRSAVPPVPATGGGGESPEVERQNGGENGTQERNTGTAGDDDSGRWDDVVAAWFSAHPQALTGPAIGISDLARAMCRDNEGGSEANYEAYKGRAHKLFHEFRASVRLPGGARLGTDIAHNGDTQ